MNKISKKEFIATLTANNSVFVTSSFRAEDAKIIDHMERIRVVNDDVPRRKATAHSNYLLFNNNSKLYFDNAGENLYYRYINKYNIKFIIKKNVYYDNFDEKYFNNYVIYII